MKKIYLKLSTDYKGHYMVPDEFRNNHNELYILSMALEPCEYDWIRIDQGEKDISIFSEDSFKQQIEIEFNTYQENIIFDELYEKYTDKRWNEMPQIDLALEDWYRLKEKWKQIEKEQPEYVVFTLDDSGPLDKVEIFGKNKLSQEDIDCIQQGHKEYLKLKDAKQAYIKNHPDYSEIWRGPQDDEYDADIMKYYGTKPEDYPDPKIKTYSKKDLALEIKQKIKQGEYRELIGYWLNWVSVDLDDEFERELWHYQNTWGKNYNISLQELEKFADKILAKN